MNVLNKKMISTNSLISKLEQRIASLESGFDLFTKRMNEESNSRLELAKSSQINYSTNAFQIQSLKEKIDLLSKSTNETLSQFKYDLTKDFSERTSHIQNIIQERSTIYETMDKKAQNTLQSKLNSVENDILTMVKKISEELTQNSAKIDFLEKRQNDNYNITREQIMDINKKIMQFQNEFTILNKFKENSNENFAGMANDIFHQQQIIEDLNSKILEQMNNYELNNSKISEELDNLKKFKEDIYKNIEMVNSKTVEEINKFIDDISNEVKNNKNEILLIEKHVSEEQKNFGNFIQEKIGNFENSVNKNLGYCDEDIKSLRKDLDLLKTNLNDFKEKTFEAVNDVEKYQNKKYDDLFRILSGNNLIKSNFRYNNKINSESNDNLELNERNNNNIVIQEQNYNIGLSRDN
jgi:predicted  nucleic acid-binding Zn-ribbon protein